MEGCEKNNKSDDLWLEAIRLHPPSEAKKIGFFLQINFFFK